MVAIRTSTALQVLRPAGVWDPLRPAIVLPEAKDDGGWEGGFERGFSIVKDGALSYGFVAARGGGVTVNTDLVKDEQLKTFNDLLDPRWKGKLLLPDVRVMGDTFWPMTSVRLALGDDVIKRLFVDQEPVLSRDSRQVAEFMVRGRFPIALGVNPLLLKQFQRQGVGKNLKLLRFSEMDTVNFGSDAVAGQPGAPSQRRPAVHQLAAHEGHAGGVGARGGDEQPPGRRRARQSGVCAAPRREVLPGGCRGEPAPRRQDAGHRQGRDQVGRATTPVRGR